MDLFKYNNTTTWENGEAVNGYDGVSWIERFRDPGEFEIKARLSSGLREFLPLGTVISHTKTMELMIVENHEVSEEVDTDPVLTITGRSFETYLQNRVVGQNKNWASPPAVMDEAGYAMPSDTTWWQAVWFVNDHIRTGFTVNASDAIPNVQCTTTLGGVGVPEEERMVKRGDLHTRLLELLAIDDIGVRVSRANMFPGTPQGPVSRLVIHGGVDKRATVTFSAQTGDISVADYLWSIKKLKNAALVSGRFVETMVYGSETGYDRRVMFVDASDIDGTLTEPPTGTTLTNIRAAMDIRGREVLAAQRLITLSQVNVSEIRTYQYRQDYNVGDIVSLDGSFGETLPMRVVEYAEIVDQEGESGQPTLSLLDT